MSLRVVDGLKLDAELFELGTRLVCALGLLERPFGTECPEQNIPHEYLPKCDRTAPSAALTYTLQVPPALSSRWRAALVGQLRMRLPSGSKTGRPVSMAARRSPR